MNPEVIGYGVGALIAALGAYLLAARRMSGKIATSDASELWREASDIRRDCRDQIAVAATRIQNLEVRIGRLDDVIDARDAEIGELRSTVAELKSRLEG